MTTKIMALTDALGNLVRFPKVSRWIHKLNPVSLLRNKAVPPYKFHKQKMMIAAKMTALKKMPPHRSYTPVFQATDAILDAVALAIRPLVVAGGFSALLASGGMQGRIPRSLRSSRGPAPWERKAKSPGLLRA